MYGVVVQQINCSRRTEQLREKFAVLMLFLWGPLLVDGTCRSRGEPERRFRLGRPTLWTIGSDKYTWVDCYCALSDMLQWPT